MTFKKLFLTLILICCSSLVSAQELKKYYSNDLETLNQFITTHSREVFIMGDNFLWKGVEGILISELKAKRAHVRVLTGKSTAKTFRDLARAGAEVKLLNAPMTGRTMLADTFTVYAEQNRMALIDSLYTVATINNFWKPYWNTPYLTTYDGRE